MPWETIACSASRVDRETRRARREQLGFGRLRLDHDLADGHAALESGDAECCVQRLRGRAVEYLRRSAGQVQDRHARAAEEGLQRDARTDFDAIASELHRRAAPR
jgi:hypothetical protein